MNIVKLLENYRVPVAAAGLFGSFAGLVISFLDLKAALKKRKK